MTQLNDAKSIFLFAASIFLISLLGCSGSSSTTTPANLKPTAVISPSADQSITVNESINFIGSTSSDPDGNTPLIYAWTFNGSATSIESSSLTNPGQVIFSQAGTVTVTLVVTDSLGLASNAASMTVNVASINLAPSGTVSHDNGDGTTGSTGDLTITAGTLIVFDSIVTDPENDPITYAWDFQNANPASSSSSGPISVSYLNTGIYNVSLTANDDNGNSVTIPAAPIIVTVNAATTSLPEFKSLPLISPTIVNGVSNYTLNVEENISVQIDSPEGSWTTPMMRYNSLQLPPVIVARRGETISVNVNNNLTSSSEETTVHWHGFKIPGSEDGGPDFPIPAGTSRSYNFSMVQPAGPLWFHPHADGTTATQVYKGLAGGFILTDDITDSLETNNQIPSGEFDVALLVQDRQFATDPNGTGVRDLVYNAGNGMLGDKILVNYVEMPLLQVKTRQYRFRIFNGSNARSYDFALNNGANFFVVGTDGGLLDTPVPVNHVKLGAGERAEIVIDFQNSFNQNIKLVSLAFNGGMGGGMGGNQTLPNGSAFDVMQFEVTTQTTDPVTLYTNLPANADINTRLTEGEATASRTFVMSQAQGGGSGGGMRFVINGLSFDINRIDETVLSGATEIWEISNTSGMAHPFHAHAIQWQILDRGQSNTNLIPATGVDLGWKDTVLVEPNETVRFIGKFDANVNSGLYMYHCHILEHEDNGMMGTFQVLQ